jgi:mannose-6-phosphate isomerase-like protein (cupin superfamily)
MKQPERPIVVEPAEGRVVQHPNGATSTIKVRSDDTAGCYSLLESVLPPGARVPTHVHHHEDEATYVLEGELAIEVGARTVHAPAGAYVVVPRDVIQSFTNTGADPCRFLTLFTPGGGERFFEEAEELARAAGGAPPVAEMAGLQQRYALEYL